MVAGGTRLVWGMGSPIVVLIGISVEVGINNMYYVPNWLIWTNAKSAFSPSRCQYYSYFLGGKLDGYLGKRGLRWHTYRGKYPRSGK